MLTCKQPLGVHMQTKIRPGNMPSRADCKNRYYLPIVYV